MATRHKIIIFAVLSLFYVSSAFAMDPIHEETPPDNPSRLFFDRLRTLQVELTNFSGLIEDHDYSPAEVIIIRLDKKEPLYQIFHINFAYEYYIQNTIPKIYDLPEISDLQRKNIKIEKAYYEYLRRKIYRKSPRGDFLYFKPTTQELDQHIPTFDTLSYLFKEFLDNNGLISKGKKLTLKKWLVFDCCDHVFSSLGTREGLNQIGEDRLTLQSIAHVALKGQSLGTWICRPSVACPDNESNQIYCRTISYNNNNADVNFNALRIIHILGIGFFQANDLNNPSTWHHASSLVEILQAGSKLGFVLSQYLRVNNSVYTPQDCLFFDNIF